MEATVPESPMSALPTILFAAFACCAPLTPALGANDPDAASLRPRTDLLASLDLGKAAVSGPWQRIEGGISTDGARGACIQFEVPSAQEFDLKVTFTRRSGHGGVSILHRGASFGFQAVLGSGKEAWYGIGKLRKLQNGKEYESMQFPRILRNGTAVTALLQLRKESISVNLEGRNVITYVDDPADLQLPDGLNLAARRVGILATSPIVIHGLEWIGVPADSPVRKSPEAAPQPSRPESRPAWKPTEETLAAARAAIDGEGLCTTPTLCLDSGALTLTFKLVSERHQHEMEFARISLKLLRANPQIQVLPVRILRPDGNHKSSVRVLRTRCTQFLTLMDDSFEARRMREWWPRMLE